MGFFIIIAIFLGVRPLENDLRLISGFHSESLYSIKSLNTKLNGAVKEIFAYVVASDTYEKEEFLKREEHFKKNQKKFFLITEQTIDARGEAREVERAPYDKIISGKIVLIKHAKIITKDGVELIKKNFCKLKFLKRKKVPSEARIFNNCLIHFPLRFIYRPRIIGGHFYVELPVA